MATIVEHAHRLVRRLQRPILCSACQLPRAVGRRMIAGPAVYICESCIASAADRGVATLSSKTCSFCRRADVQLATTWPKVAICTSCLELTRGILTEDDRRSRPAT